MSETTYGVTSMTKAWAYCNACEWTGPDRWTTHVADADLTIHRDTQSHYHRMAALTGVIARNVPPEGRSQ